MDSMLNEDAGETSDAVWLPYYHTYIQTFPRETRPPLQLVFIRLCVYQAYRCHHHEALMEESIKQIIVQTQTQEIKIAAGN